jgi:hypothetical protein
MASVLMILPAPACLGRLAAHVATPAPPRMGKHVAAAVATGMWALPRSGNTFKNPSTFNSRRSTVNGIDRTATLSIVSARSGGVRQTFVSSVGVRGGDFAVVSAAPPSMNSTTPC